MEMLAVARGDDGELGELESELWRWIDQIGAWGQYKVLKRALAYCFQQITATAKSGARYKFQSYFV
ncbi:hypothetical protein PG990_005314 [Apiospora arundinis]